MPLKWEHAGEKDAVVQLQGKIASVDSGLVAISSQGKTLLWSTGFSGCIGLVFCGRGAWGALVHLNQCIQDPGRDLRLALEVAAAFVTSTIGAAPTDVFIYYGDPGVNEGQNKDLDESGIRKATGCERVLDARRKALDEPYGVDFIYVPSVQTIYTVSSGTALDKVGLADADQVMPGRRKFEYAEGQEKRLTPGLGHKGWFIVD